MNNILLHVPLIVIQLSDPLKQNFSLNLPPDSKAELQFLLRLLSIRMMIEQTPPALHPPDTRGVKIISVVWVWLRAEDPPLYNN